MFGVVGLVKAEDFTNFLDLQSVTELGFIHIKKLMLLWLTGTDGETVFTISAMMKYVAVANKMHE